MRADALVPILVLSVASTLVACGEAVTGSEGQDRGLAGQGDGAGGTSRGYAGEVSPTGTGASGASAEDGASGSNSGMHGDASSLADFGTAGGAVADRPSGKALALTPGVWTEITPFAGAGSISTVTIDPSDPRTLYCAIGGPPARGLWKSIDAGETWSMLGDGKDDDIYDRQTDYLEEAQTIAVDPANSRHLYATRGVTGIDQGFWVSFDGGATWRMPDGFPPKDTTTDVTTMRIDPADFKHILVGSHSGWKDRPAGVMESQDGGDTWSALPGRAEWGVGTIGITFLRDTTMGIDDGKTWIVSQGGLWRTTDGGLSYTKVYDTGGVHGAAEIVRAKGPGSLGLSDNAKRYGVLYAAAFGPVTTSSDDGRTWSTISSVPYSAYYSVGADDNFLYIVPDRDSPTYVAKESDPQHWSKYQNGAQVFKRGPISYRLDRVNRIMYSANWDGGLWAMKIVDP